MSRAKDKVSNQIRPGNPPAKNKLLAQLGKFAESAEWERAFIWRWRALFAEWMLTQPKHLVAGEKARKIINEEIGETVRAALARGDWKVLQNLAEATKFFDDRYKWKAASIAEFSDLLLWKDARFVDPIRAAIAQEYFFNSGITVDEAKKSKAAFLEYVESKMPPEGVCDKTFDRACKAMGIQFPN